MDFTKVFVVHCRRTGYGVIRCIKDKGYEIYGADTWETPVSNSKYLKRFFTIPEITKVSEEDLIDSFIQAAEEMNYQESKPLIFTGSDGYLLFFSKHYHQLKKYYHYSFESDYSLLEYSLNKKKVNKLAQSVGVVAPKSFELSEVEEIQVNEFPIIIKPAVKKTPNLNVVEEAFRVKICHSKEELVFAADQLRKLNVEGIVQQYIPGGDEKLATIGTYSSKGNLIAWSTCTKERQFPPNTGECSYGKTTYLPELLKPAKTLLEGLSLTGISQIEFKEYDGEFFLIEINPRIWSWHQIHSEVGINFPQICLDYLNAEISSEITYGPLPKVKYWQFLWMDLLHNCLLNYNINIFNFFKDLLSSNQEAFFCKEDIAVTLAHTKRTIPYILRNLFNS